MTAKIVKTIKYRDNTIHEFFDAYMQKIVKIEGLDEEFFSIAEAKRYIKGEPLKYENI